MWCPLDGCRGWLSQTQVPWQQQGLNLREFCLPRPHLHAGGSGQPSSRSPEPRPPTLQANSPGHLAQSITSHDNSWESTGLQAATPTDNIGTAVMSQRLSIGLSFSDVLAVGAVGRHGGTLSTLARLRVLIKLIERLPKCSS